MLRGWKLALSTKPALQNHGKQSTATYQERAKRYLFCSFAYYDIDNIMCCPRWTALRYAMVPHLTRLELFSECFFSVFFTSCSAIFFGFSFIHVFIGFVLLWFLFDMVLLYAIKVSHSFLIASVF